MRASIGQKAGAVRVVGARFAYRSDCKNRRAGFAQQRAAMPSASLPGATGGACASGKLIAC